MINRKEDIKREANKYLDLKLKYEAAVKQGIFKGVVEDTKAASTFKDLKDKLLKENDDLNKQLLQKADEIKKLQESNDELNAHILGYRDSLSESDNKIEEIARLCDAQSAEIETLKKDITTKDAQVKQLRDKLQKLINN